MGQLMDLENDLKTWDNPRTPGAWKKVKCELRHGSRVRWYYLEDKKFFARDFTPQDFAGYSGVIILKPNAENRGGPLDIEDCVLVVDTYPCEKCYPEVDYIALGRFLDNNDLVEVF